MEASVFKQAEHVLEEGGAEAVFDYLAEGFLQEKDYAKLFQLRVLRKRFDLGLPLIQSGAGEDLPAGKRPEYERTFMDAAREVGELFLAENDIPGAWPYFRAIGEPAPVAAAIERVEAHENMAAIIEIAYQEQIHPRKGFELILNHYGICRAISSVFQYPGREGRQDCIGLLLRSLHRDLLHNLKRTIAQKEEGEPETGSISELIAGRGWLFEDNCYYIDTSHVVSVLQYSLELDEPELLGLALELAEYGSQLGLMFQRCGNPPFEAFSDYAAYFRAVVGRDVDTAIEHFRRKLAECDPNEAGTAPAQVLVGLLSRLGRYPEAIRVSQEHLRELDPNQQACPSVLQLCQWAGDFEQLRKIASEQGDVLSFTAGLLQASRPQPVDSHGS
ncbi:MAG: hypothetical protein L0387_08025 [Acidobacteria bacterium]|nr:hypothetical protein [Acidobacteriota bacterium]MCI0621602.1 hypothetical protein [Acidobacteriota bacterium]MCI0718120.1 hypothetical protein [Acidobacteriota bacterium]